MQQHRRQRRQRRSPSHVDSRRCCCSPCCCRCCWPAPRCGRVMVAATEKRCAPPAARPARGGEQSSCVRVGRLARDSQACMEPLRRAGVRPNSRFLQGDSGSLADTGIAVGMSPDASDDLRSLQAEAIEPIRLERQLARASARHQSRLAANWRHIGLWVIAIASIGALHVLQKLCSLPTALPPPQLQPRLHRRPR